MSAINFILILLALPAGGAALDRWLLYRVKKRWSLLAVRYWDILDKAPVPDYLQLLAKYLDGCFNKLLKRKWVVFAGYLAIATLFVTIGVYLRNQYGTKDVILESVRFDWALHLPHSRHYIDYDRFLFYPNKSSHTSALVFILVMLFDAVSIALMRKLVRILNNASLITSISIIIIHLMLLMVLAALCNGTIRKVNNVLADNKSMTTDSPFYNCEEFHFVDGKLIYTPQKTSLTTGYPIFTGIPDEVYYLHYIKHENSFWNELEQSAINVLRLMGRKGAFVKEPMLVSITDKKDSSERGSLHGQTIVTEYTVTIWDYLLSATTIIPMILLAVTFAFMLSSKIVLSSVRSIAMYFFELLTEKEIKDIIPFTLLAGAADVVIILLKIIALVVLHKS